MICSPELPGEHYLKVYTNMKKIFVLALLLFSVPALAQYQQRINSAPTNGTNEIQRITFGGSTTDSSTFKIAWNGRLSGSILYQKNGDADLDSAIQHGLDGIFGVGNTAPVIGTLSSGIGTINVTFKGAYATKPVGATMTFSNDGTGGTNTIIVPTAGVLSSFRSAIPSAQLIETDVPTIWVNTSLTLFSPTWAKLSATTGFITALQNADTSTTGQTLLGTKMQFAVGVSQTWAFRVVVLDSSSSSAGIKVGFAIPTGATISSFGQGQTTGVTAFTSDVILAGATAGAAFSTVATGATYSGYIANGTITTDGTHSGTVIFEFLKATSGTAIIKSGSHIIAWRLS